MGGSDIEFNVNSTVLVSKIMDDYYVGQNKSKVIISFYKKIIG